jgi:nucleotidyltransferase substrate binding protein (TIGR01987 family)
MEDDIRWKQRFSNYLKALNKLSEAVQFINDDKSDFDTHHTNTLDGIIKDGMIHRFEYTHELAWNVIEDYAKYQGNTTIGGIRDATREAFQLKLISDGKVWMDMISSRNKTSHTYNEDVSEEIFNKIITEYYSAFVEFRNVMQAK